MHEQVGGTELKHQPPPEAAMPDRKWRLFVFKGNEEVEQFHLHRCDLCDICVDFVRALKVCVCAQCRVPGPAFVCLVLSYTCLSRDALHGCVLVMCTTENVYAEVRQ